MDQLLSSGELEALLSAVDRGELGTLPSPPAPGVRAYDFRKPNRVSKDHVRLLHTIHESFARQCSATLTTLVRGLVEMELRSVEEVPFGDFVAGIVSPTCLVLFTIEPLRGGAALEIQANLLFRLIDRLLGGSGLLPLRLREFTQVEQVLTERLATRALIDLQQAWQPVGTFSFRVAHVEPNPQFLQLTAPTDVVIVVTLDMKLGDERGTMTLVFPHLLLEPAMPKLDARRYFTTSRRDLSPEESAELRASILHLTLGVRGVLAEVPVTIGQLVALEPGDVLPLGTSVTTPAVVEVEGVPRFTAQAGTRGRHRALKVLSVIPKGEVIREPGARTGPSTVLSA